MTAKHRFVVRIMKLVLMLAQVITEVRDLTQIYTDRGYQAGGADPLTTADFDTFYPSSDINVQKMTVEQFNEIAAMLVQVQNFLTGQTAVKANHSAVINKYRQDV